MQGRRHGGGGGGGGGGAGGQSHDLFSFFPLLVSSAGSHVHDDNTPTPLC